MTDGDLFPTGAVRVSGVRVFGEFPNEKVVAYTATLLRVLDCGLTRPFHDLLRSQGAFYREASAIRFHEGGVTGAIPEPRGICRDRGLYAPDGRGAAPGT